MLLCASFLLALLWAGSQGFCAAPTVACWAPRRLFKLPSLMGVPERRAKINIKVCSEFLIAVCVSFRVRVVNRSWKVVDKVMDSYCFVPLPITVSCDLYFSIPCTWPVWDNHAEWLGTPQHSGEPDESLFWRSPACSASSCLFFCFPASCWVGS